MQAAVVPQLCHTQLCLPLLLAEADCPEAPAHAKQHVLQDMLEQRHGHVDGGTVTLCLVWRDSTAQLLQIMHHDTAVPSTIGQV